MKCASAAVGGLVGIAQTGSIESCYNLGSVYVNYNNGDNERYYGWEFIAGGIVGEEAGGHLGSCYYNWGKVNIEFNDDHAAQIYKGNITGVLLYSSSPDKSYSLLSEENPSLLYESSDGEGMTKEQFASGEVAWNFWKTDKEEKSPSTDFGQDLSSSTPEDRPHLLWEYNLREDVKNGTKSKEDFYVYKVCVVSSLEDLKSEQENSQSFYGNYGSVIKLPSYEAPEGQKLIGWYKLDALGEEKDIETLPLQDTYTVGKEVLVYLWPKFGVPPSYNLSVTQPEEGGTISATPNGQVEATTKVQLTYEVTEGYEFDKWIITPAATIKDNTFVMPESDVTVTAAFKKSDSVDPPVDPEEPEDPDDGDEPPIVPPINPDPVPDPVYYHVYIDETTSEYIPLELSKTVAREGGQVSVYPEIPDWINPEEIKLQCKRSPYGYWEYLSEGVQPGEYIVYNIYSDIYVRAVDGLENGENNNLDSDTDYRHIIWDVSSTSENLYLDAERRRIPVGESDTIFTVNSTTDKAKYEYRSGINGKWKEFIPNQEGIYILQHIYHDIYVRGTNTKETAPVYPSNRKYHTLYVDLSGTSYGVVIDGPRQKIEHGKDVTITISIADGYEDKQARYQYKRGLNGAWEELIPTGQLNEYQITNVTTDIYVRTENVIYTSNETLRLSTAKVYTIDGALYVQTPERGRVMIVTMSGIIVRDEEQIGMKRYDGLASGIYIICIGEKKYKVKV